MSQSKTKPIFKADDGSEHSTAAAADRRNKVVKAKKAFKEAADDVQLYLKEEAMTADGVPFTEAGCDFWFVPTYSLGGLPRIHRLYLFPYHVSLDCGEDDSLYVYWYDGNRKEMERYQIKDLYADEANAKAAHLKVCEERMAELKKEFESLIK